MESDQKAQFITAPPQNQATRNSRSGSHSGLEIYFDACVLYFDIQHLVNITTERHHMQLPEPITCTHIYKWLGQTIIFMILKLRSIDDLFSSGDIRIVYPGKECGLGKNL